MPSLRYSSELTDFRLQFMRLCGWLQGRKVVALKSDPELCAKVLASSNVKGAFIEQQIACPAWEPVSSIESVDGPEWQYLAREFKRVFRRLGWEKRLPAITQRHTQRFAKQAERDPQFIMDAEQIARWTSNIMFEVSFERPMTPYEEELFYRASLEWRKEIAVKGKGSKLVKTQFWQQLEKVVSESQFGPDLESAADKDLYLSVFAQPLVLSPQINFSDIMVSVYEQLESDPNRFTEVQNLAVSGDRKYIYGVLMEAIRLNHPFPVLEREMVKDLKVGRKTFKTGTQVFIMLDEFEQDANFDPHRWSQGKDNPYRAMPFGSGPRVCLGKNLASQLLTDVLLAMLTQFPSEQVQPDLNHQYSGRNNDGDEGLAASLYQAAVFSSVLAKSFQEGQRTGQCPFSKMFGKRPQLAQSN